MAAVRVP